MSKLISMWIKTIAIFTVLFLGSAAYAAGTQTFSKELSGGSTRNIGEIITYTLKPACNSLTGDCGNLSITDVLPAGLEVDSCAVPVGFTINSCVQGSSNISIVKDTAFNGGDTFNITVKMRVKLDAPIGTPITNTATSVITDPDVGSPASIDADADPITIAPPTPQYTLKKDRIKPVAVLDPALDNPVTYTVQLCADQAIGNVDLTGVTFTDTIPVGATVIDDGGATVAGNVMTWTISDADIALSTLYASASYDTEQCVSRTYTLLYPSSTFNINDTLTNTFEAEGTPDGGSNGPIGNSPVTLTDNASEAQVLPSIGKDADDVLPNEDLIWALNANLDTANAPTVSVVIYDTLPTAPAGLTAKTVTSGQWNSPSTVFGPSDVRAEIAYSTDAGACSAATYTSLTGGSFITSPASSVEYTLPANTTCVRWVLQDQSALASAPAIPVGWRFTTQPLLTQDTTGYSGAYPVSVENCMDLTYLDSNNATQVENLCATANIEEGTPETIIEKSATPSNNLKPGDTVQYTIRFRHDQSDSTGDSVNPVISDLLPEQLEFISWDSISGLNGQAEPNMEVIDNYAGNDTLIRFSWANSVPAGAVKLDGSPGVVNPEDFNETVDISIVLTAKVKDGTASGSYTNKVHFFDHAPRFSCNNPQTDVNDLDGDTDTAEEVCFAQRDVAVITAAVLAGEKWIKGDETLVPEFIDTVDVANNSACPTFVNGADTYTRFPCVAQTQKGGSFKYLLRVSNIGNVDLEDYVLYDMLPVIGDTGSGEPLSTTQRGTKWDARLTGAVVPVASSIPAGLTPVIEYSVSPNPCRPEVSSTATESPVDHWQPGCFDDWTTTLPADPTTVTAFRIKFANGGNTWAPLERLLFEVPMEAPEVAPGSDVTNVNDLHPAWNSFAHRVSYGANRLSTAEPRQVGIVVPRGPEVAIGSVVWGDDNNNGQQDASEEGIAGATVKLLFADGSPAYDRDGIVVPSQTTGSNGNYYFDNLEEGNYRVEVTPPANYTPSTTQTTADNDDSIGDTNIAGAGATTGSYVSGIFELTDNGEPTGESSNLPNNGDGADNGTNTADDDNGNMTVDFGFVPPVSIGSTVFYDFNDDGLQGPLDHGIAGVTVKLYEDNNSDGIADGPAIATDTTDSNGDYYFGGLTPGTFVVGVTPHSSAPNSSSPAVTDTADNQQDGDDNGIQASSGAETFSPTITLTPGLEPLNASENAATGGNQDNADDNAGDMTVDFGFVPISQPVSIGSTVFYDNNNDGLQNGSDAGISGVTVILYASDGTTEIPVGPDGILGTVDDGPGGMVTDANGDYYFTNLPSEKYIVGVLPPSDAPLSSTPTDANDNQQDGDDNGIQANAGDEAKSPLITLIGTLEPTTEPSQGGTQDDANAIEDAAGDMTVDFGFVPPVSIGSTVFHDYNNNGLQDAGDTGIAGVVVELYAADGVTEITVGPDGILGTADDATGGVFTDANGDYYFGNLLPGSYIVEVLPSASAPRSSTPTDTTDNQEDGDDNGIQATSGAETVSPIITLEAGTEPENVDETYQGGNQDDILGDNRGDMTVDFGFFNPVSIGSTVFYDNNDNGIQDAGDAGIPGVTVNLYKDGNMTAIATTTTDANGDYYFGDLIEGNYTVGVTPLASAPLSSTDIVTSNVDNQTDGDDNGIQANLGDEALSPVIELTVGGEPTDTNETYQGASQDNASDANGDMTIDFGFFSPVSIGSTVWIDTNNNGTQDTGEAAMVGATVNLYDGTGTLVDTNTTDANGNYYFGNLPAGNYIVGVTPVGTATMSSTPTSTSDDNVDGNDDGTQTVIGGEANSSVITLSVNGEVNTEADQGDDATGDNLDDGDDDNGNMTVDFGFVDPATLVSIGSTVWNDIDNSGTQDVGEAGISGVTVNLYADANIMTAIATTTTDGNGNYYFGNLPAGDYTVGVVPNATYPLSSTPTATTDDDVDGNDDGTQANSGDEAYSSVITLSVNGEVNTEADQGDDATGDNLDDGDDDNGNMTVDFGFVDPATLVSIGSTVWNDIDNSGTQDVGESGISGVTVNLYTDANTSVTPMRTTTTDANGNYYFGNLPEGNYTVGVVPSAGYPLSSTPTATTDNDVDGNDDGTQTTSGAVTYSPLITLTVNGEVTTEADQGDDTTGDNLDDGDDDNGNMTVDFGFVNPATLVSIGSTVWIDADNSGTQDVGETAMVGATVNLYDNTGALYATTTTDVNGDYYFGNLPAGDYTVGVIPVGAATMSSTPTSTTDDDVDGNDDGTQTVIGGEANSSVITLTANGEVTTETDQGDNTTGDNQDDADDDSGNMTVDFGFVDPATLVSIGSTVWVDTNNNGIIDAGETPMNGATVNLYDNTGALYDTTTTNGTGNYYFANLPEGNYTVGVTPTSNTMIASSVVDTTDNVDANNDGTQLVIGGESNSTLIELTVGGEISEATGANDDTGAGLDATYDTNGNMTVDFGFVEPATLVSIGSTVWNDVDNNGQQDAGEVGLAGVTVNLYADTNTTTPIATVTTDANGNYFFNYLPEGNYTVGVEAPTSYPLSSTPTATTDDDVDGNDDGTQANVGDEAFSPLIMLSVGSEVTETDQGDDTTGDNQDDAHDNNGNMTVDFGFTGVGTWSGNVSVDTDNDNVPDRNLPGVTINLYTDPNGDGDPSDGVLVGTTTTDANGNYEFTELIPGPYVAVEVQPSGYRSVSENEGGQDNDAADNGIVNSIAGVVGILEDDVRNDFVEGLNIGIITGNVSAVDGNGNYTPLANVVLVLFDQNGNEVARTVTDASGNYTFSAPPGNYYIQQQQPSGYYNVSEDEGGADNEPVNALLNTINVSVGIGEIDIQNDFVETTQANGGGCNIGCGPVLCNVCNTPNHNIHVVTLEDNSVEVHWNNTYYEIGYELYLNGKFIALVGEDIVRYTFNNLQAGKVYTVEVIAIDGYGGEVKQSVTFTTTDGFNWLPAIYNMLLN